MKNFLICAIDTADFNTGYALAKDISEWIGGIKLGLEFFSKYSISGIERFANLNLPIFLDLKLHDIPNTVYKASLILKDLNIDMFTVHISGGPEMLKATLKAFENTSTSVIGVTSLTSLALSSKEVLFHAKTAKDAGLHGIVCPGNVIKDVRNMFKDNFLIITPGVRPYGSENDDHKEVVLPKEALNFGANYLVIGRPITNAKDPIYAIKTILAECK